jgi:hypothetical protein
VITIVKYLWSSVFRKTDNSSFSYRSLEAKHIRYSTDIEMEKFRIHMVFERLQTKKREYLFGDRQQAIFVINKTC